MHENDEFEVLVQKIIEEFNVTREQAIHAIAWNIIRINMEDAWKTE